MTEAQFNKCFVRKTNRELLIEILRFLYGQENAVLLQLSRKLKTGTDDLQAALDAQTQKPKANQEKGK